MRQAQVTRLLAIDVRPRRLGYAVLEAPIRLLDWGVMRFRAGRTHVDRVASLFTTFQPSAVVLRRIAKGSRRDRPIVRNIIRLIEHRARKVSIPSKLVGNTLVKRTFRQHVNLTKQEIASLIAACFPELAWRLPPPRKPWQAEDARMLIFDAVTMALAIFAQEVDPDVVRGLMRTAVFPSAPQ